MINSSISPPADSELPEECPPEFKDVFLPKYWTFEKKFIDNTFAINYLESEEKWVINEKRCFATTRGYKKTYQCNVIKKICPAAKCLFYPTNSSEVILFRATLSHQHSKPETIMKTTTTKSSEKLIEINMKPTDIMVHLEMEGSKFNENQLHSKVSTLVRPQGIEKVKEWNVEGTFSSLRNVIDYLKMQQIWSLLSQNQTYCGIRYHYRCNLVPEKGPQCAAKMFFFYNQNSNEILLHKRNLCHTHDLILSNRISESTSFSPALKRKSELMIEEHLTEEDQTILRKRGFQIMHSVQLKDCLLEKENVPEVTKTPPSVEETIIPQNNELYFDEDGTKYIINFIDEKANTTNVTKDIMTQPKKIKTSSKKNKWTFERIFDNTEFAETYLATLKMWSKFTSSNTRIGFKQYYYCNSFNQSGPHCDAKLYLLYSADGRIYLYRNHNSHSCNDLPISEPISDNQKNLKSQHSAMVEIPIIDLSEDDPTPIKVSNKKNKRIVKVNTCKWTVANKFGNLQMAKKYLKDIRMNFTHNQKRGKVNLIFYTCSDLLKPCLVIEYTNEMSEVLLYKDNQTKHNYFSVISDLDETIENSLKIKAIVPASGDYDKPFIVNYGVDYRNQIVQCFITTKRLLRMALDSRIIHADYKCTLKWRTYPMFVLGTTDKDQTFHSFGICISPSKTECDYEFAFRSLNKGISECLSYDYKPDILVCNSVATIQNAFMTVYGYSKAKIIICHEFMINEVRRKLKFTTPNEAIRNEIIDDIEKIQKLHTPDLFFQATTLFFKKWSTQTDFINYFKTTWVQKNHIWYSGIMHYAPSTNTALLAECDRLNVESESQLYCTFTSLKLFMFRIVESWTNAYVNQTKAFAQKPTIPIKLYEEACRCSLQTQIDIQEIDVDTTYYYVPYKGTIIQPDLLKKYKSNYHLNLAEFFDVHFSFCEVKQIKDADITCSCSYFSKHYVCKHSLGMATALSYCLTPTQKFDEFENKEEILS